jgi:cytochrome c553
MTAANSKLENCRLWIAPVFLFLLAWLTPALPRAAPLTGDAENGKYVAETQQKCARCHGPNGVSDDPDTPHLAGQNANYLLKELKDFKSQTRLGPNMYKRVRKLHEQEMIDIALWYQSQSLPEIEPVDVEDLHVPQLVSAGDPARSIPPCELCHAKDGKSVSGNIPVLAGQNVDYLIVEMQFFRDGLRGNDPGGIMETITKKMFDVEFEGLARYYAALGGRPAK